MLQRKNLSIFTFYKGAGDHFSWRKTSNTWNVRQKQCLTPMLYSYYTYVYSFYHSLSALQYTESCPSELFATRYISPSYKRGSGILFYGFNCRITALTWPFHAKLNYKFLLSDCSFYHWTELTKQLPQNLAPGQIMVFLRVGVLNTGLPLTRKVVLLFAPDILKS